MRCAVPDTDPCPSRHCAVTFAVIWRAEQAECRGKGGGIPVIVPGGDGEEGGVFVEDGSGGFEEGEEVWRKQHVLLDEDRVVHAELALEEQREDELPEEEEEEEEQGVRNGRRRNGWLQRERGREGAGGEEQRSRKHLVVVSDFVERVFLVVVHVVVDMADEVMFLRKPGADVSSGHRTDESLGR
eukprot:1187590-Rhodomonas_salina.1